MGYNRRMKIYYDFERIDKLLHDVHALTGLTLGFWDNKMNLMVIHPPEQNPFCREIRSTAQGLARCIACDHVILEHCAVTRRVCTRICHAGLPDSALPLYYQDQLLGFITYGQLINTSMAHIPYAEIEARLSELAIDFAVLRQAYINLPRYDNQKLDAVTTIVSACIQHTLLEKIVSAQEDTRHEYISDYINKHLNEPITHETLAREFHISKSTLYDTFNQHFHMSVHAYIEKKRMERACDLLINTSKSVLTIALDVGIDDQNYFARRFKKHYGLSPSKYRSQNQKT